MIGRLAGTLLETDPPFVLVDVAGVGYELEVPLSTLVELPRPGEPVTLVTHLAVKEDSHSLYGFLAKSDRVLFRSLLRVSGVGAKLALAILSGVSTAEFARLVGDGDAAALTRLPGIGKKTAERLIVEMRDKLGDLAPAGVDGGSLRASSAGAAPIAKDPLAEASAALGSLGYKPAEVDRMVRSASGEGKSAEEIIRDALRGQVKP